MECFGRTSGVAFRRQKFIGAGVYVRLDFSISKSSNFNDFGYRRRRHYEGLYGINDCFVTVNSEPRGR